jgi:hypothetical protein
VKKAFKTPPPSREEGMVIIGKNMERYKKEIKIERSMKKETKSMDLS